MKILSRVLLVLAIIGLGWAVYNSIRVPVDFENTKAAREKAVIKELMDIRSAQIAYKQENNVHAANFEELRNWLNTGTVKSVRKVMELSEKQLQDGMTEQKAWDIVKKARATGNWKEAEEAGLSSIINGERVSFTRDTTYLNAKEAIFGADYDTNKLGIIPFSNGVTFEMDTASVKTSSDISIKIFEAKADYDTYLGDLNKTELINLKDRVNKIGKYPGLKVGSLTEINNNAGNWE